MNRIVLWITISISCCSIESWAASGGGQSGRIPSYINSRFGPTSPAVWVSASSAVDAQGHLIRDSLPGLARIGLEQQLASGDYRTNQCVTFLGTVADHAGPVMRHSSLKELTQNSVAILRGTVTDIDQGFAVGQPALLLEVQVAERIKDTGKFPDFPRIYIPYFKAEFKVGEYRFCNRDSRWPDPPKIGDELLLFPYRAPYDDAGQVLVPDYDGYEIIFERKGLGQIVVPPNLRDDEDFVGVRDLKTIRNYTVEHLRQGKPQER
jgi:hypothetical protein